ncbi:nuclear transport factor 2 family protein [uncultured Ruegeria sp.]|uniref:nuclear transport factor 2 family protein n=1 Tax=uncultured Ruegeria sp. TaxID=259304 RepID=UPI00260CDB25|nr:nuclear transport factor 2 family protein [uncultured Ruegeria sp.]
MAEYQDAKALVHTANTAIDAADGDAVASEMEPYYASDILWRGMHPFHEQAGIAAVADTYWRPLKDAMGPLLRRPDIFFAGSNEIDGFSSTWVVEMGHLMGTWDRPWISLAPSRKLAFLRYCEFHRIEDGRIAETACYVDILNLLAQSGRHPISGTTGSVVLTPGPATHDGLLYDAHPEAEGRATVQLIADMVTDLRANKVGSPEDHMTRFWTPDMCWFGPGGIGASAFFDGYRRGHSGPFEDGLEYVTYTEHVARLGESNFGGFFGYPSLTVRSTGGFMGLPPSDVAANMRIVDLYRRDGDRLAENWIFIDIPHFIATQGVDILAELGRES